jgi:hypothetical protein
MPDADDVGAVANSLIANSKGALITSTGSAVAALSVGTNDHILTADSTAPNGIKWAAAPASGIPATLLDAKGDLIVATAADTAARLAVGTNGHALVADSAATPGVKWGAVGKVLQAVSVTKTDTFSMTGTTFTDITDLSVSITPTATTSKILVIIHVAGNGTAATTAPSYRIVRDSTAVAVGDTAGSRSRVSVQTYVNDGDNIMFASLTHLDSPATTSSTTYKVQMKGNAATGTNYLNRTVGDTDVAALPRAASSITVLEIGA